MYPNLKITMNIGVVVIGRNEGERLVNCLTSIQTQLAVTTPKVYVDSDSQDDSPQVASKFGFHVISLDDSVPYTAARSRNTGMLWLCENYPDLEYIQFLDGDCELAPGWLEKAIAAINQDEKIAVVCGRRREKYPDASVYNLLADIEWDTPVGEAKECGGDALIRVQALQEVQGYNSRLICGEEPEMCLRMRQKSWRIMRIDADMTWHDAAMYQFGQWWKRSVRGGWAVAQGAAMYGQTSEKYMVKDHLSGWFWGLILPLISLGLMGPTLGLSAFLLLAYPLLLLKMYRSYLQRTNSQPRAIIAAYYGLIFKFAQVSGQIKFWLNRWQGKQATLIEYKKPNPQPVVNRNFGQDG